MKDHPDDFLSKVVCLLGCSRTSLDAQSVTANDGERRIREAQVRHVVREGATVSGTSGSVFRAASSARSNLVSRNRADWHC